MKIGIIGATGHTGYVLDSLAGEEAFIAGIAPGSTGESMDELAAAISRRGWRPSRFNDYRALLDEIKPDITVVACYFSDHAKVAVEALKRGAHVFMEKPVATTFEDLATLKSAYEKSGRRLAAMFGLRYTPAFLTAHQAIGAGVVGQVRLMHAQKSYKLGERGVNYRRRILYGGTIPWVGSHAIDWLYWLSGERFRSVFASHSTMYNREHGELELTALCHFTFTNEVFGSVTIDYLRPSMAPGHGDDRIRVTGTKGIIEVRDERVYLLDDESKGVRELPLLPGRRIFTDFLHQIRGTGRSLTGAADSFYVTEACLKAREAADRGRIIYF